MEMKRYYMGVDWGDQEHGVWVSDETGAKVAQRAVKQTVEGMEEWGQWLHRVAGEGIAVWAAIEKPEGRIVDFLLDHGVKVYPVNPKALDRARDRFRMSGSKSDPFDARVLAEFLRTDNGHLAALSPNSERAQELKIMTRDYHRLVRQRTRLVNQLTATLKEYYPRPLEVFEDVSCSTALAFLKDYPTPQGLLGLRKNRWHIFAKKHFMGCERADVLWEILKKPQGPMPEHVIRAKSRLVKALVEQLEVVVEEVKAYEGEIEHFFASMPAATLTKTLPGGKSGTTVPTLWAELGDGLGRWASFQHLQAQAGAVPVTKQSGRSHVVHFRFACSASLRHAVSLFAFISLRQSEWARAYYRQQRERGHHHHHALRALGAKWLKIFFVMWRDHVPYDETYHLANMTRQHLRQAA